MNRKLRHIFLILMVAILFAGCSVPSVEQMYQLPKRSDEYNDLQLAIDKAMVGLEYCAPLTGENRQTVQMADLDGDGQDEYLLFAKGSQEKPLRILVFQNVDDTFVNICNVECSGSAFDQIEYVNMDDEGGVEVVVGCQLSDQVIRSASVYSFAENELIQLTSVNYTKFLTVDLDNDSYSELFLLRNGQTETDNGVAELYSVENGTMVRYNEVNMSQPADKLKRLIIGRLVGGKTAVYVASAVGDTALITDVYTTIDGKLTNVTLSNESGTSIQTMRNFYVYADDIDNDGIVELPSLITMKPKNNDTGSEANQLIRWYSMTPAGEEVDKMYTYHNFVGGWYMQIDSELASRLVVVSQGNETEFYVWNNRFTSTSKLMTISAFTGQNREEQGLSQERFILHKTESVVFSAQLENIAAEHGINSESAVYSFRMIQQDWKTGET